MQHAHRALVLLASCLLAVAAFSAAMAGCYFYSTHGSNRLSDKAASIAVDYFSSQYTQRGASIDRRAQHAVSAT